ncbi:hypothetical protein D0962_22845 [Leptolyngbyaceae cyanobacterium CCMR0082]|uniref:Uncharacterized protein n=1 Tax=Adonisia turfae CCMR0082 TaxID=2304604 RepID=A0A6M0SAM6_9CYAN|nr:hypothetical protein [Adonisia turfae]NEZ65559.1 hypothetical protein [Adonisia turfae CCMR0082]
MESNQVKTVVIRDVKLKIGEYSDFDILPLERLAGVFGGEDTHANVQGFDQIMLQAWKSLQAIFGESLPKEWFDAEIGRLKLHVAEVLLIAKAINEDLLSSKRYRASRNEAAELTGNEGLKLASPPVVDDNSVRIAELKAELAALED